MDPITRFLDEVEDGGTVDDRALEEFALEHDLDDEAVVALRAELAARDVEIASEAPAEEPATDAGLPVTTDAMTLFMNRAGRYRLLTAAEEVALAKRVERGDRAA
jgi:RNA polymerase primary sigma factor